MTARPADSGWEEGLDAFLFTAHENARLAETNLAEGKYNAAVTNVEASLNACILAAGYVAEEQARRNEAERAAARDHQPRQRGEFPPVVIWLGFLAAVEEELARDGLHLPPRLIADGGDMRKMIGTEMAAERRNRMAAALAHQFARAGQEIPREDEEDD